MLAAKEGEMKKDNRFMLESILDLKDREIHEVMVHRKDIFSVNINENKDFFSKLANETPYSRFPVWENNSENIIGIVYVKDLLRSLLRKKFDIKKEALLALSVLGFSKTKAENVVSKIYFENKDIELQELIKKSLNKL